MASRRLGIADLLNTCFRLVPQVLAVFAHCELSSPLLLESLLKNSVTPQSASSGEMKTVRIADYQDVTVMCGSLEV